MEIELHQIDAFTDRVFAGNPAAVCPLDCWPEDDVLAAIAAENNLSETAFLVPETSSDVDFHLRWFTPTVEVDLCGHATLASGHYLLTGPFADRAAVTFQTRSGVLSVTRDADRLAMDFPAYAVVEVAPPAGLAAALGVPPTAVFQAPVEAENGRYIALFEDAETVRALTPDLAALSQIGPISVCVTAAGAGEVDFVSRYFAPNHGVDEDPVTGSNHSLLAPFWGARLGKASLNARQVSARGGALTCRLAGERVIIGGQAVTYLRGTITIKGGARVS